jgi:hypothetical protein
VLPLTPPTAFRIAHLHVARPLHHDDHVRVALVAVAVSLCFGASTAGCFYGEPINERPSAEIQRVDAGVPMRGDQLSFRAIVSDPDQDPMELTWRFQACAGVSPCSSEETGTDQLFNVTIPASVEGLPTTRITIDLDVKDIPFGATARPAQHLELDVENNEPTVTMQRTGRELDGAFPPNVPITVNARGSDPDMDPLTLTWELFPPRNSTSGVMLQNLPDPLSGGEARFFIPDVDGEWTVRVTADDGLDIFVANLPILVVPDQAPCLGALDPSPPPATSSLILDQPRRISVLSVEDDLDIFPAPLPDDPYLGPAELRWYVRAPGQTSFTLVDTGVGGLELDPAHYDPGDHLDVRVEIDDRMNRTIPCAEGMATCSITQDACLQRQTWSVEVR